MMNKNNYSLENCLAVLKEWGEPWNALIVQLKTEWSSLYPDHRVRLRQDLYHCVCSLGLDNKFFNKKILVPGYLGDDSCRPFSISHCPVVGGFLIHPLLFKKFSFGLDVEDSKRVSKQVVQRITKKKEWQSNPNPASLWVAKESLYKSLPKSLQPTTLSELEISQWHSIIKDIEPFSGSVMLSQRSHDFLGIVMTISDLKVGISFFPI